MLPVSLLLLIPLLPFAGFIIAGLAGRRLPPGLSGIPGTLFTALSFFLSLMTAWNYFFVSGKVSGSYSEIIPWSMHWLDLGGVLSINMGILLDPISVMMIVMVTFISLMVHLYSIGYMKGEERVSSFFAFLSLFTFSMLGLVLSSNLFQTYVFWELVGISSFFLIGFHYQRPGAVAASKKAFIVTRFADLGFLIGILILSYYSGSLDYSGIKSSLIPATSPGFVHASTASFIGVSAVTWGLTLVFAGGAGKSAMFPLHIWLPDAMEGPTPVSALIHAATMVVAGVYLVARLFPLYVMVSPGAAEIVTCTGAVSAFLAAVIACTQTDIKRILAYSTMSQIGFMMFALGVSGYGGENGTGFTGSMFHLFNHAMFKALLFLASGLIIHFVHSNEIKDMGGLRKKMPVTHITFLIACLAIAGIPPFSGFFSKEEILLASYQYGKGIYVLALITSGITAFYMFRLYYSIFWNRESSHHSGHREGKIIMLIPLLLLGILSAASGFIPFGKFVSTDGKPLESEFHLSFSLLPVGLAIAGILLASLLFKNRNDRPGKIAAMFSGFYLTVKNKFYIDEMYLFVTKNIILRGVGAFAAWFDRDIINGLVNTIGAVTQVFSLSISEMQSGKIQGYASWFFAGLVGLILMFIYIHIS